MADGIPGGDELEDAPPVRAVRPIDLSGRFPTVENMTLTSLPNIPDAFVPLTGQEAAAALTEGAFALNSDEGHRKAGDKIVHTRSRMFGADWDLDEAVEFVQSASRVGWLPDLFMGHDLIAYRDGREIRFDVRIPVKGENALAEAAEMKAS